MVTKDLHPNAGKECGDEHASLKAIFHYDKLMEHLIALAGPELTYHPPEDPSKLEKLKRFDQHSPVSESVPPPEDDDVGDPDGMILAEMAEARGESVPPPPKASTEVLPESRPSLKLITREEWIDDEPQRLVTILSTDVVRFARQTADEVICRKVLPIKVVNNVVCIGLTCYRPMGAHGEPIISAPFAFLSDQLKFKRLEYSRSDMLYAAKVRPMASVMMGREEMVVAWEHGERFGNQIVWFPLEMAHDLLGEPKLEDLATMTLLRWVEKNDPIIRRRAYSADYDPVQFPEQQSLPVGRLADNSDSEATNDQQAVGGSQS
jgi:hypothetical protein